MLIILKKIIHEKYVNTKITSNIQKRNVFTEVINKIVLCSNDDKRMQLIDSIETYAHKTC